MILYIPFMGFLLYILDFQWFSKMSVLINTKNDYLFMKFLKN